MKHEFKFRNYLFKIVNNSPWPFFIGMSIFCIMLLNGIMLSYGFTIFKKIFSYLDFIFYRFYYLVMLLIKKILIILIILGHNFYLKLYIKVVDSLLGFYILLFNIILILNVILLFYHIINIPLFILNLTLYRFIYLLNISKSFYDTQILLSNIFNRFFFYSKIFFIFIICCQFLILCGIITISQILFFVFIFFYWKLLKNLYIKKQYKKILFFIFLKFMYLFIFFLSNGKTFNTNFNINFSYFFNYLLELFNSKLLLCEFSNTQVIIGVGVGIGIGSYLIYQLYKKNNLDDFPLFINGKKVVSNEPFSILDKIILEKKIKSLELKFAQAEAINIRLNIELNEIQTEFEVLEDLKNRYSKDLDEKLVIINDLFKKLENMKLTNESLNNYKQNFEDLVTMNDIYLNETSYLISTTLNDKRLLEDSKNQISSLIKQVDEFTETSLIEKMHVINQNLKIDKLNFELEKISITLEQKNNELDIFKGNLLHIYKYMENTHTKTLGVIINDINPSIINIYSIVPNNELYKYNLKKLSFSDVIYNQNWDITMYFFNGLTSSISNSYVCVKSDIPYVFLNYLSISLISEPIFISHIHYSAFMQIIKSKILGKSLLKNEISFKESEKVLKTYDYGQDFDDESNEEIIVDIINNF